MYIVKIKNINGETHERSFSTYREALCYATNYYRVKKSIVLKDQDQIAEFKF